MRLDDSLRVARVTEIRGTKVRAKVFKDKNEAFLFHAGKLVRNVSVGGYVKIPCGFDHIIGRIEGEVQEERFDPSADYSQRVSVGTQLDRVIEISVFGVKRGERFDRGITILPLVSSDVYVLTYEELALISSHMKETESPFRLGSLVGQEDVPVIAPASALFAGHIGIFGNTGSGKSNTLCRLYTDCFNRMRETGALSAGKSHFVFVDFNGEYAGEKTLCSEKKVYRLDTSSSGGGDKIPVPADFYLDLDVWAILTQATEKTQRPFLRRCLHAVKRIQCATSPDAYIRVMVRRFLEGYFGNEFTFVEQREDFIKCMALALDCSKPQESEEEVRKSIENIELFGAQGGKLKLAGTSIFGNDVDLVVDSIFASFNELSFNYAKLVNSSSSLVEFVVRFQYLERWRSGSISREHIASLLPRLETQLKEARKLYVESSGKSMIPDTTAVAVYSLMNANSEQKKLVPLVISKYLYREQRKRGREDEESSTHLIVDEAHNILSYDSQRESEAWRDYRLETFEEIIKEGRKFGMYLTVCSQRPSDISPTIISQLHNYFIHRLVNDDDLNAIGKAVSFIDRATNSMIPVLPQGACVASGVAIPYPIQVQFDLLPTEKQPRSADRDLGRIWGFDKGDTVQ